MYSILETSKFFKDKSKDEIINFMSKIDYKIIDANKNDLIFTPFTETRYMGILLTGELFIERILPCGKNIPIFIKEPGDLFGEAAVFSDALTYPCNVLTSKKSKVLLFSKDTILKLLALDNNLLNNLLSILANKALYLNNKIELFCYASIKQKIAYSILYDFNISSDNKSASIPFSKKMWSETINVSRPSLYRELKLLENENIIKLNAGNIIQIINKEKLNCVIMEE